jgi:hypothetical protein
MFITAKEKRLHLTIELVAASDYHRRSRMITIGKMPRQCKSFFKPVRKGFHDQAWNHFWMLVVAITISHGSTLDRLAKLLRGPAATHRTNHGEFLWRSEWDESSVLQQIAWDTLRRVMRQGKQDERCYFIIDDTQTLKRAKKMQGVGKLYHHATKTYGRGHTIVKVCLYINGVTIPWGSYLYLKKDDARRLNIPFQKLTELAAAAIDHADLPKSLNVTVLFDAFYLCQTLARACRRRGWHYIGVGKSNGISEKPPCSLRFFSEFAIESCESLWITLCFLTSTAVGATNELWQTNAKITGRRWWITSSRSLAVPGPKSYWIVLIG